MDFSHDGYLLGSYRIATAPEPNSRRVKAEFRTVYSLRPPADHGYFATRGLALHRLQSISSATPTIRRDFARGSLIADYVLGRQAAGPVSVFKAMSISRNSGQAPFVAFESTVT